MKGSYIFNTFAIRPDIVSTEIVQSIQMVHLHDLTPFHYRMYMFEFKHNILNPLEIYFSI